MNNKGFIYIETIITVVILLTTLVLLYSMYSRVVTKEKERLYYDDMAYIYKTMHLVDTLDRTLGYPLDRPFEERFLNITRKDTFNINDIEYALLDFYNVDSIIVLKIEDLNNIKSCLKGSSDEEKCTNMKLAIQGTSSLKDYLLTIDVPEVENAELIAISVIKESKNGFKWHYISYDACLDISIQDYYETSNPTSELYNNYYKDKNIDFSMTCEYAVYLSWVYV